MMKRFRRSGFAILAVALMVAMQACGTVAGTSAHGALAPAIGNTPTPEPTPPSAPAGRQGMGGWAFQSRSPWNIPISKTAAYEAWSTACSSSFHSPSGGPAYLSAATWTTAIYYARATDPWQTLTYDPSYGHPAGVAATIRLPADAVASPPLTTQGGDARMYIIDPAQHYVDEFWKAYKSSNGTWTVGYYVHTDLFSQGIGMAGVWSAQDSGLGGVIRAGELNGNLRWPKDAYAIEHAIPHAIAIATTRALQHDSWVWPAISNDVEGKPDPGYKGVVPMGQFVAIPGGVDLTKLGFQSIQGLEMAFALQNYGAYLVNSSSDYASYAEMAAANDLGNINQPLRGHLADIDVIQNYLACVDYNGPTSPGSGSLNGAQRRVCWAPWLPTETPIANQCVYNRPAPLPMPH